MFRRSSDGIAVPASIRMNDGAILVGTINCGMSGRWESLLSSDSSFLEFVSKDGQQRFLARHQVASIEPLASIAEPKLPTIIDDMEPFQVLGLKHDDTLEHAMMVFQTQLKLYTPEQWSGQDIPFEFSRYAAEKTRQINMAFTAVRAAIQARNEERHQAKRSRPFFGAAKAVV
jgi:hypothetical protein